jgi:nucleotide-binding universal stress UspA family protein
MTAMETTDNEAPLLAAESQKSKLSPRARALVKAMGGATAVLYALGWAVLFARQENWDPVVRATYGYQLGWVACLASCAVALVLRRSHAPAAAQEEANQEAEEAVDDMTRVSPRARVRRRRFVMSGGRSK